MDKSAAILIVDDYLLIRSSVRSVLSELGFFNVHQADNGKAAQELMRKQPMDIVIGDWNMPVMTGLELLRWMRMDQRYARVPFMMLTAESNPASVRTALQAGVNAYMIKPFTVHSFASKFMTMVGPVKEATGSSNEPVNPVDLARETRTLLVAPAAAAPAPVHPSPPPPLPAAAPAPAPGASADAPALRQEAGGSVPRPAASDVIGLAPPLAERLKKCTVLVVDDIPTNIEVIAGALKDDYSIKVAISGRKAIEIANAFPIDLILLDIMMPVMDGFETCRQLKANPATADIPIIFLSARDGVDDVVAGLRLGAVDYVSKPADPTILKARLSAHLTLSTALQDLKKQNAALEDAAHLREDIERMTRHDLKSPIAVALQASQSLLGSPLDERQREQAGMIEEASSNALELINRTLDVYKMEMGDYKPALEAFDLEALLRRVGSQVRMTFAHKDLQLDFQLPSDNHCLGEPLLCYTLFSNLFKNAAEASPNGGRILVEVAPGFGDLHVVIDNEGEVPADLRERFFDKYATSKPGGTGLGTYSSRLMAEVQGGSIEMESQDGHTRLTVTLPAV